MSGKNLSAIRAIIRQFIKDEFVSGTDLTWEDDELDLHISDCLGEISEHSPYKFKETLTTTASSRELDISSIDDLLSIDKLEYKTGSYPRNYRNFNEIDESTIEIDTTLLPAASENVYVYCNKLHSLTESSSTLKPQHERVLILGVAGKVAIAKSRSLINAVNVGGAGTPKDLHTWGITKLAEYRAELKRLVQPKTYQEYPKS